MTDALSIHSAYERACETAGIPVAEFLAHVLAEHALTKADPINYIAYVMALAAKRINQQTK